jgi:hypothetical protein
MQSVMTVIIEEGDRRGGVKANVKEIMAINQWLAK